MNLLKIDLKHLAMSGAVGIFIHFIFVVLNDMKLLTAVSRSALMGVIAGLLIQITYKAFGRKIKNNMLWTNIVVFVSIAVVIIAFNLLMGNTDIKSLALVLIVSTLAGISVVFFQHRYYKQLNKRLEMKLADIVKNKNGEMN